MKIIKSLKKFGLLLKDFTEAIKNEGRFFGMLLGTLEAGLLGNFLTGKGVKWSNIPGDRVTRAGEGTIRADEGAISTGQDF